MHDVKLTDTVDRVQDTARWVAMARALESERKDAVFNDHLARKLAGSRGEQLVGLSRKLGGTWPIVARTYLIDKLVSQAVGEGVDAVLNLAAGFDSRPYRLGVPSALTWMEVDHADVIEAKEEALEADTPRCHLERISMDLSNAEERRTLLQGVRDRFQRLLIITEGLLFYLPRDAALGLAKDLLSAAPFRWITDLHNSAVSEYVARRTGNAFEGTARMQFSPDEGPLVFAPLGWRTAAATSSFKTAGRLGRLPFPMSLLSWLPERPYGTPGRPWAGVCVLEPGQ